MTDRPCYECPDRFPGCSDSCRKPTFLAQRERERVIRENRRKYNETTSYTVDQIRRNRRVR